MPDTTLPPHARSSWREHIIEFIRALAWPSTYNPLKNTDTIFGFLWGIPVPIFLLAVHMSAAHLPVTIETFGAILNAHPIYVFFLIHPLLFAVVFGALGTMRAHRDERIQVFLAAEERQNRELLKTNAQLAELDRLKTEFLANVTHELKSPLVTAIGYNERILGGHLGTVTDRQRGALEVSRRNLTRLRNMIAEIMDFSRLDAGVAHFEMAPVRLDIVAVNAIENLELKASERRITFESEFPPEGAMVVGDAQKLLQVATNIMDNAIKFSPDGGKIRVEIAAAADGVNWKFDVTDHGCGIAPDAIPKLFQRFQQVDGSRARNYEGIGLGLVVVKKIIEAHGGKVWIESRVGEGTTLHVELKKAQA